MPVVHMESIPEVECSNEEHVHLLYKEEDHEVVGSVELYCTQCNCRWELTT